jgi:ribose transport system substrate-binding protein
LIALAGCSSSGAGKTTPNTTAAGASSSAGGTSSPASGGVAAAQATIDAATAKPDKIPVKDPLKSKPEPGKTLVYMQCEVAQCVQQGKGIASAAEALGFTYKVINFQAANPATLVTGLRTALNYKPLGVYFSGVPYDAWKAVIPDYRKAHAYLIPASVPNVPLDDVVVTSMAAEKLYTASGTLLADVVISQSKGSAKVMFVTIPTYPIYTPLRAGFEAEIAKNCDHCDVHVFEATLPQVTSNQLVPALVSELKRNPNIKYIASVNGVFIATLPAALRAVGIDPGTYKIMTHSGVRDVQQFVQDGTFYSTTAFGYQYEGWLGVDAALRASQGLPVGEEHQLLPLPLLTKDTVGTPLDSYDLPTDYQAQFKKLWLLGS